jgi:hypothetical protein
LGPFRSCRGSAPHPEDLAEARLSARRREELQRLASVFFFRTVCIWRHQTSCKRRASRRP